MWLFDQMFSLHVSHWSWNQPAQIAWLICYNHRIPGFFLVHHRLFAGTCWPKNTQHTNVGKKFGKAYKSFTVFNTKRGCQDDSISHTNMHNMYDLFYSGTDRSELPWPQSGSWSNRYPVLCRWRHLCVCQDHHLCWPQLFGRLFSDTQTHTQRGKQ